MNEVRKVTIKKEQKSEIEQLKRILEFGQPLSNKNKQPKIEESS